jgi:hypothetical protein
MPHPGMSGAELVAAQCSYNYIVNKMEERYKHDPHEQKVQTTTLDHALQTGSTIDHAEAEHRVLADDRVTERERESSSLQPSI